jgi:hypothetical protein
MYTTEMAGPLKCLCLSEENMGSGLYLDHDSENKLADEEPSVWNIPFSDSKQCYSEEHAHVSTWKFQEVLDTYQHLEGTVLGCVVMHYLISRMILLP